MLIFKVVSIALLVCVISLVLKQYRPDLAMLVSVVGGIVVIMLIVSQFTSIFLWVDQIASKTGTNKQVFGPIVKIIGIGYVAEFAASVCEDSGNKAMSNKIVLAAKIVILVLSMPVLSSLVDIIVGVL